MPLMRSRQVRGPELVKSGSERITGAKGRDMNTVSLKGASQGALVLTREQAQKSRSCTARFEHERLSGQPAEKAPQASHES